MSPERVPADAGVRARALDPSRSFLVQAPAGSGKTELLIQRFLRLLATVREPEEILAITFTRKAAAEMRARVMGALACARRRTVPEEPHLRLGYELACAAVERDAERGWNLAAQPRRLRIGTIDSVNAWLSGRSPLGAGGMSQLETVDDATPLYQEAARETVALAADEDETGLAVRSLLGHFDNRAELLVQSLAGMLARRDQWLRLTGPGQAGDAQRAELEKGLACLLEGQLQAADARIPADCRAELTSLLAYAAGQEAGRADAELAAWLGAREFPPPRAAELGRWRALANALLTRQARWRSTVDVRQGFPPADKAMKARMLALLRELQDQEPLRAALALVARLPDPAYPDSQWRILKALLRVLPVAAALLRHSFLAHGRTDFSQVAADALSNLGRDEAPGELSLVLDYRLSHLLLDEYQDTSRSQYELLLALTWGWEPGDGRSVFLVGDPMQSIYRFREAEVGVYLQTRETGLGHLPLEFLRLETNFRADPALTDWTNRVFSTLLPAADDRSVGAVRHAPSEAFREAEGAGEAGIHWHVLAHGDRGGETDAVAGLVREIAECWPEQSIGILVRSRNHAAALGPLLRAEGIVYSAPDIETLGEHGLVQDLLALTRALVHRADRIAWLALLRAPWCGLSLADLHALAARDFEASVWSLLREPDALGALSEAGRARAAGLVRALAPWLAARGRCTLRDLVEGAWLQLAGPATVQDAAELELVDAFLDCVEEQEVAGDCIDVPTLVSRLQDRKISRPAAEARVQIMTMHKAKGLEFDTVILPGLGYRARRDEKPAMLWLELVGHADPPPLVMAPVHARGGGADSIYELLWSFDQRRTRLEADRLLYVASTRARRRLHLVAGLRRDGNGEAVPEHGSLMQALWPAVAGDLDWTGELDRAPPPCETGQDPDWRLVTIRRLPAGWTSPVALGPPQEAADGGGEPQYEWAGPWARHVGSVVHRWLEEMARRGVEGFDPRRLETLLPVFSRMLERLGTPREQLPEASRRVLDSLTGCVEDECGRWLLSDAHPDAASELAVTVREEGGYRLGRIDRCFVTPEGERWIVDFKTGTHEGADLEEFLASEVERYRAQLRAYRDAMNLIEARPTRTALYFPLLGVLREVDVDRP